MKAGISLAAMMGILVGGCALAGEDEYTHHCARLQTHDLEIWVADNAPFQHPEFGDHPAKRNGLWRLVHREQGTNIFWFSGLNYECTLISGVEDKTFQDAVFPARKVPMTLTRISQDSVKLHQTPEDVKGVEAIMTYSCKEPHYVDFEICFVFHKKELAPVQFTSLWASYMNGPDNIHIYFLGLTKKDPSVRWLKLGRDGHSSWQAPMLDPFWVENADGSREDNYEWAHPFYYGLMQEYVYILMFDRLEGVRIAYSPTGGDRWYHADQHRPAWDFSFSVAKGEIGKRYVLKGRLAYKKFLGRDDVVREFEAWSQKNK